MAFVPRKPGWQAGSNSTSTNPGTKTFHVQRVKGSEDSTHTLDRDEVAGLRKLREAMDGPYVFVSERGGPISADMVAGIGFHVHPHMLRHSAGHMVADEGLDTRLTQDFLCHRDIRNIVRYTKLSPHRLASVRVR
jgi:site-specific recombinase XerD